MAVVSFMLHLSRTLARIYLYCIILYGICLLQSVVLYSFVACIILMDVDLQTIKGVLYVYFSVNSSTQSTFNKVNPIL